MEPSVDEFNPFFHGMSSSSFGVPCVVLSMKNTKPLQAYEMKTKAQGTLLGSSKGALGTRKKKIGSISSFLDDLYKGKLDPVLNEMVSHLARFVHYIAENITLEAIKEIDRLGKKEHYG